MPSAIIGLVSPEARRKVVCRESAQHPQACAVCAAVRVIGAQDTEARWCEGAPGVGSPILAPPGGTRRRPVPLCASHNPAATVRDVAELREESPRTASISAIELDR